MFLLVLTSLLLAMRAQSLVSDGPGNPYQAITDRNIFALRPIPIPVRTPAEAPKPPVKITLCGITDILGRKQALLKAQIPPRPPEPAKEESYILAEKQSEGDIEVLAIDQKAGTVKVNNHGMVQTLDFENNGAKLPAASSIPVAPVPPPAAAMPTYSSTPPQGNPPAYNLTVEQQAVLIEAQRAKALEEGDPVAKLFPPTMLTPALQQDQPLPQ